MITKKQRAILARKKVKMNTNLSLPRPSSGQTIPLPFTPKIYRPSWSVYSNIPAGGWTSLIPYYFDHVGYRVATAQVRNAGAKHFYDFFTWSTLEPHLGQYDDTFIDRMIEGAGTLPIWLNIMPVNLTSKSVPPELASEQWDSARMITAYSNLISHLREKLAGKVVRFMVGNEVDSYFSTHLTEISPYATFINQVRKYVISSWGAQTKVAVTFTAATTDSWSTYALIHAQTDFDSLTYYFLDGGDSQARLLGHALNVRREYVYQEIGFTSDVATWASSEAFQDAVFQVYIFGVLNSSLKNFAGATIFTLEDYSAAVLTSAGYIEPNLSFFRQTGLRNTSDVAKVAWARVVAFLGSL